MTHIELGKVIDLLFDLSNELKMINQTTFFPYVFTFKFLKFRVMSNEIESHEKSPQKHNNTSTAE